MIKKLLIANRGEIACRIITTAKRMGIETLAVYSDSDQHAKHVSLADNAAYIGPAPARESYLKADTIIAKALEYNCCAIHPGYGFLAENAAFASACDNNHIIFVGPSAKAIDSMGSKSAAKALMDAAGVPTTRGYWGDDQSLLAFEDAAAAIGYPVLLKASAGGGGKGMRLVESPDELQTAIDSAKRESAASFGDDKLLLEKYLTQARHVEVQIFFDQDGHGVTLFDRDCSIQRRHQKIIEEAPAPYLSNSLRQRMAAASLAAGKAVQYCNAGTIEFLVQGDDFYFMEMNTRLQVEHPVTEMITGLDLVEWQLRIASNEPLPLAQSEIQCHGHAIEARICAEDTTNNFAPSAGHLPFVCFPNSSTTCRIDTGVRSGDTISPYYDPMIAKLIVHGKTRTEAIAAMTTAIHQTAIVGVCTNVSFLSALCAQPAFSDGILSTQFLSQQAITEDENISAASLLAIASLAKMSANHIDEALHAHQSPDHSSPWNTRDGWQIGCDSRLHCRFWLDDDTSLHAVVRRLSHQEVSIDIGEDTLTAHAHWESPHHLHAVICGQPFDVIVVEHNHQLTLFHHGVIYTLHTQPPSSGILTHTNQGGLNAPMHGTVIDILVKVGDVVQVGDALMLLEAMKMEHTITANTAGTVSAIHFSEKDAIAEGDELLEIT